MIIGVLVPEEKDGVLGGGLWVRVEGLQLVDVFDEERVVVEQDLPVGRDVRLRRNLLTQLGKSETRNIKVRCRWLSVCIQLESL